MKYGSVCNIMIFIFILAIAPEVNGAVLQTKYLSRLELQVINIRNKMECLQRCLHCPDCLYINYYHAIERQNRICVLNAATVDERYAVIMSPGQIVHGVDVTNWVYVELM